MENTSHISHASYIKYTYDKNKQKNTIKKTFIDTIKESISTKICKAFGYFP